MTPKEKAKELYDQFLDCTYSNVECPNMGAENLGETAKKCALICVEELLKTWDEELYKGCGAWEYWQEVKQEIEKL